MITPTELAFYCFLKEIDACDRAARVFDKHYVPSKSDVCYVFGSLSERWADVMLVLYDHIIWSEMRTALFDALDVAILDRLDEIGDNTFAFRFRALYFQDYKASDCGAPDWA